MISEGYKMKSKIRFGILDLFLSLLLAILIVINILVD